MRQLKKLFLSIALTICMLLSSVIAPMEASASNLPGIFNSGVDAVSPVTLKGNNNSVTVYNNMPEAAYSLAENAHQNNLHEHSILEMVGEGLLKGGMETAAYMGTCLAADALATSIFPPAAAIAPYCVVGGQAAGGTAAVAGGGHMFWSGLKHAAK